MAHHSSVGAQPHVVDQLVEYFSGSLTPAEDAAVESHLLSCAACRSEYDELGPIALTMTLQPQNAGEAPAGDRRTPAPRRPTDQAPRGPSGPGHGSRGDPSRRPRAGLRRFAGYAAILAIGAAIGVGATVVVHQSDTPPLQNVDDSKDISTDRLSVTLVQTQGGTQVRAAAVGLRPGRGFQVVAVSADGKAHLVATGVADGGLQSIVGTVPVPASDIVFVALVEDGTGALLITRPS
jgi:anti-sigma factor RsiW